MSDICEYLGCHAESTTKDIAEAIGADRHTVSKELQLLEEQGRVTHREHGPAKLWRLTDNPLLRLLDNESPAVRSLKAVFENVNGEISIQDTDRNLAWPTTDEERTQKCYEHHIGRTEPCPACPIGHVIQTGNKQTVTTELDNTKTTLTLIPIKDDNDNVTQVAEHMIQW